MRLPPPICHLLCAPFSGSSSRPPLTSSRDPPHRPDLRHGLAGAHLRHRPVEGPPGARRRDPQEAPVRPHDRRIYDQTTSRIALFGRASWPTKPCWMPSSTPRCDAGCICYPPPDAARFGRPNLWLLRICRTTSVPPNRYLAGGRQGEEGCGVSPLGRGRRRPHPPSANPVSAPHAARKASMFAQADGLMFLLAVLFMWSKVPVI